MDLLAAPLTDEEWRQVDVWLSRGAINVEPLSADANHNAELTAANIFCNRALFSSEFRDRDLPPVCIFSEFASNELCVRTIKQDVVAKGPLVNWTAVSTDDRLVHVLAQLGARTSDGPWPAVA